MFYRPITKGGWHAYLPVEKGVFRHNIANWIATICQNPLLRTYFLVIVGFSSQEAGKIRLHQKLEIKGKSVFIWQHVSVSLVPLSSIK